MQPQKNYFHFLDYLYLKKIVLAKINNAEQLQSKYAFQSTEV